jgi:hypothetical protein
VSTYTGKAFVRKGTFLGLPAWVAARPGGVYLMGAGLHFEWWEDAMKYATTCGATPEWPRQYDACYKPAGHERAGDERHSWQQEAP